MAVVPVILKIFCRQQDIHCRRVFRRFVAAGCLLFGRMHGTDKFGLLIFQFIKARQQQRQKCHVIIQQHLAFSAKLFFQLLAQPAVIGLVNAPLCQV